MIGIRKFWTVVVTLIVLIALTGGVVSSAHSDENFCKTSLNPDDALNFPSRHAWNVFTYLNHPVSKSEYSRGEPDCEVAFGSPGHTSLWETWRLAPTEVFLEDGSEPPEWADRTLPSGQLGSTPDDAVSFHGSANLDQSAFQDEEGVFRGRGGIGESRMNRSTFEFIKDNCLWSSDGLQRYNQAFLEGKKPLIKFPRDSIEVKAVWLEFSQEALDKNEHKTYYTAEHDDKIFGLTSFHILTKDVPNWFWATFHHKEAPENEFELKDTYGPPSQIKGTVWENYVLGGTQTDFVDEIGRPSILSDHYIEFGFQRSSCITCHSQASGSPDCLKNDPGQSCPSPAQTVNVGVPDPNPFLRDDELYFIPTDFLWSIPFRVRPEKNAPPKRCIW